MKTLNLFLLYFLALSCFLINAASMNGHVTFKQDNVNNKVDVFIDNKYFTSYLYTSDLENRCCTRLLPHPAKKLHADTQ